MKKSIFSIAAALVFTAASAQETVELKSKKGENYLPQANDWSIGFDALPLLGTVGNLMATNANTTVTGTGGLTNVITGKMFKDASTAYRGMLGINFGSTTTKTLVDDVTNADPTVMVTDESKTATSSITIGAGLEKRRGNTRLQGYYGGMLAIMYAGGTNVTNTFGNALSATNTGPQTTSTKSGSTFGLNLNGIIGAEYFVLPKVSIGAEYWWGVGFSSTGDGESTTESFTTSVVSTTTKTAGGSSFNIGGSYASTMVFVNLHF